MPLQPGTGHSWSAGTLLSAFSFIEEDRGCVATKPASGLVLLELPHLPVRSDAAFAEILYTFVLCFVVLNVATLSGQHLTNGGKAKQIYGLAIGFCIVVGGYAIGAVSGGSLNPAVSFALDTSHAMKGGSWMNCIPYADCRMVFCALCAPGGR